MIGWWTSLLVTCGDACTFNVALFDAIGTWVGGVAVATIAGGYALYRAGRDRADKAADEARVAGVVRIEAARAFRDREHEAVAMARACAIRFVPKGDEHNGYSKVHIVFANKLFVRVFDVALRLKSGETVRNDHQVHPERQWGEIVPMASLKLSDYYSTAKEARKALNETGKFEVDFLYTIDGFRFQRTGKEIEVIQRPESTAVVPAQNER